MLAEETRDVQKLVNLAFLAVHVHVYICEGNRPCWSMYDTCMKVGPSWAPHRPEGRDGWMAVEGRRS